MPETCTPNTTQGRHVLPAAFGATNRARCVPDYPCPACAPDKYAQRSAKHRGLVVVR